MIDFSVKENDLTGKVDIRYTGTELLFQKLIVDSETCPQLVFTNSSNPVLIDFLMGKSIIELDLKTSGIFNVELFFLQKYSKSVITTNYNLLQAVDILSDFYDATSIFINGNKYGIDKSKSTDNNLFLDRPIDDSGDVWKAKSLSKSFSFLRLLKDKLVDQLLSDKMSLIDHQTFSQKCNIISLIEYENDFEKQKSLFKLL